MKPAKTLIVLILISCFISCSQEIKKDPNSQFYSIKPGARLVLNRAVTILANTGRTFFQNGHAMKEKDINIYYPHCSLTVNTIAEHNRTIQPMTFIIHKVVDHEEYAQRYIMFASRSLMGDIDGPSIIGQASYYHLQSDQASDVRTLECVQWGTPYEVKYVSINDIRKSLGEIFTLHLNDK